MKVKVKGKGQISLDKNEFLGQGGEGSVYAKGDVAYKLYHDPSRMIPVGKISELSVLTMPNIIRPLDVILGNSNEPIGYTMRYLDNAWVLCQFFAKKFREKQGVTPDNVFKLVKKIQTGVQHCHQNKVLIVDCNEMNFLISKDLKEVFFIDVDSYQTPSYHATAIMPSVRDYHSSTFSELTDWFSWGIVTFQLFIGIHPYKGFHPNYKPGDLEERMKKNVSIFNPQISLPAAVYPLGVIPQVYREWYKAVFEEGKRLPPPTGDVAIITLVTKVDKIVGSNKFKITEINDLKDMGNILNVCCYYGTHVIQGSNGILLGSRKIQSFTGEVISFTPEMNHVIAARSDANQQIVMRNLSTGKDVPDKVPGTKTMVYDGRLYTCNNDTIYEVEFVEMPLDTRANVKVAGLIMEKSSKIYDGVIIQNLLDACYVSVFPHSGKHNQVRIKELEGYRIIDAKFESGVLMVVGMNKNKKYDRLVFRFDKKYDSYDIRIDTDITYSGLNFTVLDNGVCVHIDENEKVNIFRASKDDAHLTVIEDRSSIDSDMTLYHNGSQVLIANGTKLYTLNMK